jgi:hypothetical protein
VSDEQAALFADEELRPARAGRPGVQETSLRWALSKAFEEGRLSRHIDGPLADSAMILARALDAADRIGGLQGGYLAAQAQPALLKTLHALRMPVELKPDGAVPLPVAPEGQTEAPSWVRDAFGTPE